MKHAPKVLKQARAWLTATLILSACNKNDLPKDQLLPQEKCASCKTEIAFPEVTGTTVSFKVNGKDLTLTKKSEHYILDGDIILTEQQIKQLTERRDSNARTGVSSLGKLWPNRTVYYTVSPTLPWPERVTDAIAHWQSVTNLVFVQRTNQPNYVEFVDGSGCSSNVGMVGGRQVVTLNIGCSVGNTIHEIGHAIGFFHEHTRTDRNAYIIINSGNIQSGVEHNFQTYAERGIPGFQIGELDFGSIMLYDSYAFSNNGQPTIVRLNGSTFTSQRNGLSAGDIATYNYMYNRPYIELRNENFIDADNPLYYGTYWDVYAYAWTDASKTTPWNVNRNTQIDVIQVNVSWGGDIYQSDISYNLPAGSNVIHIGQALTLYSKEELTSTSNNYYLKTVFQ